MKYLGRFWTCLVMLVALAGLLLGGGYFTLFHTSVPLKTIAAAISRDGKVMIEGVSGNLRSGVHVERVEIQDSGQPPSELEDINLRYGGTVWSADERVIIEEATVSKATVYVDLPSLSTDGAALAEQMPVAQPPADSPAEMSAETSAEPAAGGVPVPAPGEPQTPPQPPFQFVQINRARLGNLVIRDLKQNFELTLPEIEWTGFRLENGRIDPGDVTIDSDEVQLETQRGRIVDIEGQSIEFQKYLAATAQPALHAMLRDTIDAQLDLSVSLRGLQTARLMAFGEAVEAFYENVSRRGFVRITDLDVAHYVSGDPFDLPPRLNLDVAFQSQVGPGEHQIELRSGNFRLGLVDFVLEPQTFRVSERYPQSVQVRAVGEHEGVKYVFTLTIRAADRPLRQRLTAEPALEPQDVLAQIFLGKPYAELTAEEEAEVRRRLPLYTDVGPVGEAVGDGAVGDGAVGDGAANGE